MMLLHKETRLAKIGLMTKIIVFPKFFIYGTEWDTSCPLNPPLPALLGTLNSILLENNQKELHWLSASNRTKPEQPKKDF